MDKYFRLDSQLTELYFGVLGDFFNFAQFKITELVSRFVGNLFKKV